MPAAIVGREAELASIRDFVGSIADGATALVLEGEAGVGKTTVWSAGIAEAEEQGVLALRSCPAESETALSFSGVGDLLDAVLDAVLAPLPNESARQQAQPFNLRQVLASDSVESARQQAQPFNLRHVLASDSVESAKAESQPFNLRDVLASDSVEEYGTALTSVDRRIVGDNYREPPKPVNRPTTIAASDSGREIEWSQIGMGFGLGILLAIGLFLAMRSTRVRHLAH